MQSNVWVCCINKGDICMCVNTQHSSLHTILPVICLVVLYKKLLLPMIHIFVISTKFFTTKAVLLFQLTFIHDKYCITL